MGFNELKLKRRELQEWERNRRFHYFYERPVPAVNH